MYLCYGYGLLMLSCGCDSQWSTVHTITLCGYLGFVETGEIFATLYIINYSKQQAARCVSKGRDILCALRME